MGTRSGEQDRKTDGSEKAVRQKDKKRTVKQAERSLVRSLVEVVTHLQHKFCKPGLIPDEGKNKKIEYDGFSGV